MVREQMRERGGRGGGRGDEGGGGGFWWPVPGHTQQHAAHPSAAPSGLCLVAPLLPRGLYYTNTPLMTGLMMPEPEILHSTVQPLSTPRLRTSPKDITAIGFRTWTRLHCQYFPSSFDHKFKSIQSQSRIEIDTV